MQPAEYVAIVSEQASLLGDVAEGALDVAIPSCPEWAMADLVWHVSVVGDFWRQLVDGTIDSPRAFGAGDRPADDDLVASYRAVLHRLVSTLAAADPAAEVWTWSADHSAGFIQRRMAQELTVHSWDGHRGRSVEQPIDAAVAVDGVEEFIEFFLPQIPVVDVGDGIHLHSSDANDRGEWLIRAGDGAWVTEHRHAKGTFAARGPASDLLLLLWGRRRPEDLQTFGDPEVFARFTEPV
ncbi:MAG: maleylpyruvate isomerase family mycothiol-dependent enzyme [Actinomycetota bacterium]|nr:maleylpyruvate isomerase family mycothiol-dependent enzyme [Actinomycetota bacterium]